MLTDSKIYLTTGLIKHCNLDYEQYINELGFFDQKIWQSVKYKGDDLKSD